MTRMSMSSTAFFASIALVGLVACGDVTPPAGPTPAKPQFGAQPVKGVWTVNSLDDPGTGSCTPSYCALRQAIDAAASGDKIVFKSGLSGAIALSGDWLTVEKSLSIDGGGRITIDGLGVTRQFVVEAGVTASLTGLTLIRGGNSEYGGAIYNSGALTLNNVVIRDNQATSQGGGVNNADGALLTIIGSTIVDNSADGGGGGVANEGTLDIKTSTITDNSAAFGGGIYNFGTLNLSRSTVSGNSATNDGGGIFTDGPVAIRSSTITRNTSQTTGALRVIGGKTSVANSIVAGNQAGLAGECSVAAGSITSLGYNLSAGCFSSNTDVVVSVAAVFSEVLEQTLKDNGGPTKTHALIERGRAIDAGSCPGETTDQRGFARPYDDSRMPNALDACDIGAFEWRPPSTRSR